MRSTRYSSSICKDLASYSSVTVGQHHLAMTLIAYFVGKRADEAELTSSTVIGEQSYKVSSKDISTAIQYVHERRSSEPSYL